MSRSNLQSRNADSPSIQIIYRDHREICRLRFVHTFFGRLRGLLGKSFLPDHSGIYLDDCRDIHTFGMQFTIDVVMINSDAEVVFAQSVVPNRIVVCRKARHTIEMSNGMIERLNIVLGEKLVVGPVHKEKKYA